MNVIDIKLMSPLARIPELATEGSAAVDLVATSKTDLGDGRLIYGLGIALDPKGFKVTMKSRSSIHKTGLSLANGVGLGDPDYRGEYMAVFYNIIPSLPNYEVGDRVCQLEIETRHPIKWNQVETLNDTQRGSGGFGSTGK